MRPRRRRARRTGRRKTRRAAFSGRRAHRAHAARPPLRVGSAGSRRAPFPSAGCRGRAAVCRGPVSPSAFNRPGRAPGVPTASTGFTAFGPSRQCERSWHHEQQQAADARQLRARNRAASRACMWSCPTRERIPFAPFAPRRRRGRFEGGRLWLREEGDPPRVAHHGGMLHPAGVRAGVPHEFGRHILRAGVRRLGIRPRRVLAVSHVLLHCDDVHLSIRLRSSFPNGISGRFCPAA